MRVIPGVIWAALAQAGDARFRGVLVKGVALTVALLAAVYAAVAGGILWLVPDTTWLPFVGDVHFVGAILSAGSVLLMIFLSVFLMVPVASAFTGIFLDEVADAVEAEHYQGLDPALRVGLANNIRESLGFLSVMFAVNLAVLLFYFTPLAPFVFYGLNGYLLGREYYRMVAIRRLGRAGARAAFRRHRGRIWALGALMAVPLTVPVLNLFVPVVGVAAFTHLFHRLERI